MATMTVAQLRAQTAPMEQVPDPQVPELPRPPRQYPAAYKLWILGEYEQLDKAGKTGARWPRSGTSAARPPIGRPQPAGAGPAAC